VNDPYIPIKKQLTHGFYPLVIKTSNLALELSSPSSDELDQASLLSYSTPELYDLYLISISIVSINGRNILGDIDLIMSEMSHISTTMRRRLFTYILCLMEESRKAYDLLEAFCYEDESRLLWRSWKASRDFGLSPVKNQKSMTALQTNWIVWNTAEDERLQDRLEWDRFLFSASAMNSSVNKIRSKWDSSEKDEERRREDVRRAAREGDFEKLKDKGGRGKSSSRVKTEDVLREEMRKWVAGEEDEHDRIIREYKDSMRRNIQESEERAQRMSEEARQRRMEMSEVKSTPIVALTEEQVKRLSGSRKTIDTSEHEERNSHVISKYLINEESKGNLSIGEDGAIFSKDKKRNLMSDLSRRSPLLEEI
jgi:hypothetical protein